MPAPRTVSYYLKYLLAIILTGIGAGIAGILLSLLLHFVQHLAFGYSMEQLVSSESFLQGVTASAPWRRVLALFCCGLILGTGLWALYKYGKKLVTIEQAVQSKASMPFVTTLSSAILQIIGVALGSPLGREVAPREVGALLAQWFAGRLKLTTTDTKIILACGAGAGLAAVYNVPLAGAFFTLEVLLLSYKWPSVIAALLTSAIATMVAWLGLGDQPQYQITPITLTYSLIAWAIVVGPLIGSAAFFFVKITDAAKAKAPKNWRLIPFMLFNFLLIGLLAIPFPALLGNGKGPLQLGFDGTLSIQLVALLLLIRFIITLSSLRVGAKGGLLTPGLMHGALLAILLGSAWNLLLPSIPMATFAVIGATAFLAASMKMPITAIILMFELTRINHDSLIPMLLAVVGSVASYYYLNKITNH